MPGAPDEVTIPQEARNQVLLQKVAKILKTQRLIIPQDKQAIIDLGAALMSGELQVARRAVESLGSHIARLVFIRDSLSGMLMHLGVNAVQIVPGQAFQAPITGSKPVEAVFVTLRCNRTGEAIGIPSHPGVNTQVFKMFSTGDGTGLIQTDEKADHPAVFRRLSAMMAHADTSAPPPWAEF
ncbi:MAG: hypothetical protein K2W95_22585 [Candidatus Obscuribacterales bacterium]|nr:hypothetical protein [Candidatus Obscuribacterales bacterium]